MDDATVAQSARVCTKCGICKPLSDFYLRAKPKKHRAAQATSRPRCKACSNEDTRRTREANIERYREMERISKNDRFDVTYKRRRQGSRLWHLKFKFGITLATLRVMMEQQEGKCAVCGIEIKSLSEDEGDAMVACVDHDHDSGLVRGLLCNPCNRGLGCFLDSSFRLEAAANYLRRHGK